MATSSPVIVVPVFGGQGITKLDFESASKRYALYTSFPSGAVLYDACHDAFHTELRSLPSDLVERLDICAADFKEKVSILCPIHEQYSFNPIISGTTLLLHQTLQYLLYVQKLDYPIEKAFHLNTQHKIGILGFSSGILTAAVVAASRTKFDFIKYAVEAYRLAFWIGVRVQLFRCQSAIQPYLNFRSWALAIISDKSTVEQSVQDFNKSSTRVFITAVIDHNCVTVSGHPDDLADFRLSLPDTAVVCETSITGLYHVPSRLLSVRREVLGDVVSRGIQFPALKELSAPLRCSYNGEILCSATETLVASVVDMIILHPVNWDKVVNAVSTSVPFEHPVQILAFEGSKGLVNSLSRGLQQFGISSFQCREIWEENPIMSRHEPIAIIGMAVNMPGSQTVDELWNILRDGATTLQKIPGDRFEAASYTSGQNPGRSMNVDTGNFVKDIGWFDNKFFGINPREAKNMDPQQRILLHVAYEALEDAGYNPDSTPTFLRNSFGCYIGAATHDYIHNLNQSIDIYYATGTLGAFLSGRLSFCLGLSGPSMVIDTACSSSLVAIHQACRALSNGDCNAALAGGVNAISSPSMFIGLDKAHFLSSRGCKSFDASADGYSRGEGCGLFVLKRLADAMAENDRILGIIRGIEVNQSGLVHSITHPHAPTQELLFKRLLARSNLNPHLINYVESHGTGTQAGDVVELRSLRKVLSGERPTSNPLYVGSLKANIGHLEAASGSASLAKVLLMLRHKMVPPQVLFKNLNPNIPCLDIDNTVIPSETIPWLPVEKSRPKFAIINNFGASGSNAAMIVEEYTATPTKPPPTAISSYVFALSAKDDMTLEKMRARLIRWLDANKEASLADLSYTLMARRQIYTRLLVVTGGRSEELISRLMLSTPCQSRQQDSPVVFVFSGQGPQFLGMGSALYQTSSGFRKCITTCDSILLAAGFSSILPFIIEANKSAECPEEGLHSAVFSMEYALAMLWMSLGIKPSAVAGHSLGEYVALVIAGVFSLSDALLSIAKRSLLMSEKCARHSTGMLAVTLEPAKLRDILESFEGLTISCFNSPQSSVISGPISELKTLKEFLESTFACQCVQLDVPYAYHSPAMAPILHDLAAIGRQLKARVPTVPVVSSVFGRVIMSGDGSFCDPDYIVKHCASPVRFVEAIESYVSQTSLYSAQTIWVEISLHPSLSPMLKSFPPLSKSDIIPSLHKSQDNWIALTKALASVFLTRSINWRVLFAEIGHTSVLSLPSYPFSPKNYWVAYQEPRGASGIGFSVIQNWEQYPCSSTMGKAIFTASISHLTSYMEGHCVGGVPLCPASVLVELVAAGVELALKYLSQYNCDSALELTGFSFTKPLSINSQWRDYMTGVDVVVDMTGAFSIRSRGSSSDAQDEVVHSQGQFHFICKASALHDLETHTDGGFNNGFDASSRCHGTETFSTQAVYDFLRTRIVDYSRDFQTIQSLTVAANGLEATADVKIDVGFHSKSSSVDVLLVDTLLHIPGFIVNRKADKNKAYICSEIGRLVVFPGLVDKKCKYIIYCNVSELSDGMLCESYAFRVKGRSRVFVASAQRIRFQCINLAGLKISLGNMAGSTPMSCSNSMTVASHSASNQPIGARAITQIFAQVLGMDIDTIDVNMDLGSLGLDSLSSLEVMHLLAIRCRSCLPPNLVNPNTTIRSIQNILGSNNSLLDEKHNSSASTTNELETPLAVFNPEGPLWCLQKSLSCRVPLVLIHDGSGLVACYRHISDIYRNLYGISNPKFQSSQNWTSIRELAAVYAGYIQKEIREPILVGGWSFGGVVAFEVARILRTRSFSVKGVVLIDSPSPFIGVPLDLTIIDYVLNSTDGNPEVRELCKFQFQMSSNLLKHYRPSSSDESGLVIPVVLLRSMDEFNPSDLEVPSWLSNRREADSMALGDWATLSGSAVRTLDIPGNHFQPFKSEYIELVSCAIAQACEILDS